MTHYPSLVLANRASGVRLSDDQKRRIADCDRDTRSVGLDLMLRGGKRLALARTALGITWEVVR